METLPIAQPSPTLRSAIETATRRVVAIATELQRTRREVLDWLRVEHDIEKPSVRIQTLTILSFDEFVAEVRKLRGKKKPLSLAALRNLREEHERTVIPAQSLAREAQSLERQLSELVNSAYGLTPEETRLMWETAPPRMPISSPVLSTI